MDYIFVFQVLNQAHFRLNPQSVSFWQLGQINYIPSNLTPSFAVKAFVNNFIGASAKLFVIADKPLHRRLLGEIVFFKILFFLLKVSIVVVFRLIFITLTVVNTLILVLWLITL